MSSALLERDAQIATVRCALGRASKGDGSACLIAGPAGIGKTALLDVVREAARESGARVLGARASELDRGFGFGIVHQLLEPTVHAADEARRAELFAGAAQRAAALFGATAAQRDPEYSVLSGLYWLIVNLAEERPLVLCVDDLHWADVASLRMLEFLTRRLDGLPILVAGTARLDEPGAPTALLAALQAAPATDTIELAPLSADAVGSLLAAALGTTPEDDFRDAARHATGGNPLWLSVLAREAAGHEGLRGRAAESARLLKLGARGVAPVIVRRLEALGAGPTAVARAVAVVGERARLDDVVELAAREPPAVRRALDELADAGILDRGGRAYLHPLVRAAVLTAMPHPERDRMHREAAQRLRERGARPAEVALHWLATEPAGDANAVADLRAAAVDAASEGAASTAVDLLRRALAEGAAIPDRAATLDDGAARPDRAATLDDGAAIPDRAALLLELAELELRILAPEGRARMQEALAAGLEGEEAARAHAALGPVLLLSDPVAALAEIETAHTQTTDPGLRLRLEALALEALVFVDALADARRARYQAIRDAPDPSVVELAHLAIADALGGRRADEVASLAGRAVADGALLREVGPGGSTWNLLGHALRLAERPEASRRVLEAGDRVVRERGLRAAGAFVDQAWGYWHRDFGSVARGLAHAQAGYDAVRESDLPVSRAAVAAIVAENLVLLDRVEEADRVMDEPIEPVERTFVEAFALTARGLTRTLTERYAEAEVDLRRVVAILGERGWHAPGAALGRTRLAELLVLRERPDEARELVGQDIAAAEAARTPGMLGAALRVRARTEHGATRLATLHRAERALADSPLRMEHGRALLDLGAALRHDGDRSAARAALRRALDGASRAESTWLGRLAWEELRASGARPRRARIRGVDALTPSERRIAELAGGGFSNREIAETLWVTHKTVEYHLGNVYAKLEISSRDALPAALGISASG